MDDMEIEEDNGVSEFERLVEGCRTIQPMVPSNVIQHFMDRSGCNFRLPLLNESVLEDPHVEALNIVSLILQQQFKHVIKAAHGKSKLVVEDKRRKKSSAPSILTSEDLNWAFETFLPGYKAPNIDLVVRER